MLLDSPASRWRAPWSLAQTALCPFRDEKGNYKGSSKGNYKGSLKGTIIRVPLKGTIRAMYGLPCNMTLVCGS